MLDCYWSESCIFTRIFRLPFLSRGLTGESKEDYTEDHAAFCASALPQLGTGQVSCSSHSCDEILHFLPVFAPIRVFYPARNVNCVRPELANCVRHIFGCQPAGYDKRFIQIRLFQERPFEPLAGSTKRSFPMAIDQKAKNGIIVNSLQELDVFQPKRFEYGLMVSGQRFTKFPRLFAMKLQSVENIRLQQLQSFIQSRIDDNRDSRDLGRQPANPRLFLLPLNESCRSRVQIESQSVRSTFDSGYCIRLTSDPTKLDENTV